jgi:hypothetical protein
MKCIFNKTMFSFFLIFLSGSFVLGSGSERIKLVPFEKPKGEFGFIGFRMTVPWMDGEIEMRLPETLGSEEGLYFIDHYRADMPPLSKVDKFPEWKRNEATGEISYSYSTTEGVEFGAIVNSTDEEVHIEFFVKNNTNRQIKGIYPRICLPLTKSNDFNQLQVTSDVFIYTNGKYISLDKTTPTAAEKGRDPLLVILRKGFTDEEPGSDIGIWWVVNEASDEDIIVRESKDKKHLVAVSWPGDVSTIIYNSLIPCIHAGPTIKYTIDPQRERHWYGTIYLMQNDKAELLKRYKNGQRYN